MHPTTLNVLRAIAALANEAQARPTSPAIPRLRVARGAAEAAWLEAGAPDLPAGVSAPLPPSAIAPARPATPAPATPQKPAGGHGWGTFTVEVVEARDRSLVLSTGNAGDEPAFFPRAVIFAADGSGNIGERLDVGDVEDVRLPLDIVKAKGWKS